MTNGNNFLQVFLDGVKVYENDKANLQMPEPFNAYLEPESSDGEEYLTGSFVNYYVTSDENIQVTNLPSNAATVDLANGSAILQSGTVSGGEAAIPVSQFNLPLSANIQVYDSGGNLIASSPETMFGGDVYSFAAPAATAPTPPTGLVATGGLDKVSLDWSAPVNNGGSPITNYNVYRSTIAGNETLLAEVGNMTTYEDSSVKPDQAYFYKVTAISSVGESSASNEATASTNMTAPPSAPQNLSAIPGNGGVFLRWQSPSSDGGSDLTGYKIYRGTTSDEEGSTPVGSTNNYTLSFNDTGLANGQPYFYKVTAINSAGESKSSNEATATPSNGTQAPSAPAGLVASPLSSSQISLAWNTPSSNGGSAITGYKIERSANSGTTWSVIVSNTGTTSTTYIDSGLSGATTYSYRVSAVNGFGASPQSNIASATTPSSTPGVPSAPLDLLANPISYSQINLSWTVPSSNGGSAIEGYEIERSSNDGATWAVIVPDSGSASTEYSDAGLAAGKTYAYKVSATNAVGTGPSSNATTATTLATAPSSPTGLAASVVSSSEIDLSWNAPGWNGGAPITGYKVERSTDGGSTWATIVPDTGSAATTYSDTGLVSGTGYTYQVLAINSAGTSTHSNVVSATTS